MAVQMLDAEILVHLCRRSLATRTNSPGNPLPACEQPCVPDLDAVVLPVDPHAPVPIEPSVMGIVAAAIWAHHAKALG
ncbi:hypothetical protein ACWIGD_30385 [Streptomyces albidoflavus]